MKKSFTIIGVFILVAVLCAWGSRPTDQAKSAPRWEYKQITRTIMTLDMSKVPQDDLPDQAQMKSVLKNMTDQVEKAKKDFEANLKTAGTQGWELVAVTSEPEAVMAAGLGFNSLTAFLKRPAK